MNKRAQATKQQQATKPRVHVARDVPVVYVRPAQAEQMYNISRRKLYDMMAKPPTDREYLASAKVGSARLIRCADIERLLEEAAGFDVS